MPKLKILIFDDALSFDAEEMNIFLKSGIELQVSLPETPNESTIKSAHSKFSFFGVKAYYFNNSLPRLLPDIIIFGETEYERAKVLAKTYEDRIIFIIGHELEDEKVGNFYVTNWNFIEEYVKSILKGEKKDGKSTAQYPKVHGREG